MPVSQEAKQLGLETTSLLETKGPKEKFCGKLIVLLRNNPRSQG